MVRLKKPSFRPRLGAAGWLLFALVLPAIFAHIIAWNEPILCRVNGKYYAPALAAMVGLPAPGPFGRADKSAAQILLADPGSFSVWPLVTYDPEQTGPEEFGSPSGIHLFGTDGSGRDLFAMVIHGGRASLLVALISGLVALLIGLPLGGLAGYAGGWCDRILSRLAEVFAAFPAFFLVLAVMSWRGPNLVTLALLLGVTRWVSLFRYARAEFQRLKQRDYVRAAQALGRGPLRIAIGEILPNAWGPILVCLAFMLSGSVLFEAGLSWIGLGVPVHTPSWGHMLKTAHQNLFNAPHLLLPPAMAVTLMVFSWNAGGEALRRKLDVQER